MKNAPHILSTTVFIAGLTYSALSTASGFRIPEISALGTGSSNALVANNTEIGALGYNPAGMSFHQGKALAVGLTNIGYDLDVTTTNGSFSTVGEDSFMVPNLFFMASGTGKKSFGLAINAPFGLETAYADETFPAYAGPLDGLEPSLSRIKMINTNPNIAYKIDDMSSLSIGVNFYDLKELVFNSQAAFIDGSGSNFGLRLGYLHQIGNFSFGLSYSSSVDIDLKGSANLSGVSPTTPPMAAFASVELPSLLQLGVAYRINNNLQIEMDIEQTGWSSFDTIEIKNSAGTTLTSTTNNWEDVTAYRLGVIYQLNEKAKLLFGYSDDPTPQKIEDFSARVPDADRVLYSIGFNYELDKDMSIDVSYLTADVDTRTINSATPFAGGEPNGTQAYNGTYTSSVNLISIGLNMKF